jgi:hypothetical protein
MAGGIASDRQSGGSVIGLIDSVSIASPCELHPLISCLPSLQKPRQPEKTFAHEQISGFNPAHRNDPWIRLHCQNLAEPSLSTRTIHRGFICVFACFDSFRHCRVASPGLGRSDFAIRPPALGVAKTI